MKGELVVVRSFTGPLIRRIWDLHDDAVFAVNEDIYTRLENDEELLLIGLPLEDVFITDGNAIPDNPDYDTRQQFK